MGTCPTLSAMRALLWFRDDLRVQDNLALLAATESAEEVVAVYLLDEHSPEVRPLGGASKWWLHHSLNALHAELKALGIQLIFRTGAAREAIPALAKEIQASAVFWNRRYGASRAIDADIKQHLHHEGIEASSFPGHLLFEPWNIANKQGDPYKVFTPFWRACREQPAPAYPKDAPDPLGGTPSDFTTASLDQILPLPTWPHEFAQHWQPGAAGAYEALEDFLDHTIDDYADGRDVPALGHTSKLSPHLRFGEISPREVWHAVAEHPAHDSEGARVFLSELGWREFAWHTLYRHPDLATRGLDRRFDAMVWEHDPEGLTLWQQGKTGFGLVDAGLRELWRTGTMHNRVRMAAASLLVKNMMIDWRLGEQWFWDTLLDADEASNPFNWQWVAGCGADASPYFRIFNPETQQKKFDANGKYVNRWAPDWMAHTPVVDLRESRARALTAFDAIKGLPR
ncbi:Deoxyribodipyrimidine photo-lyase [Corynebacterium pelargi]|uniref:Deoxyribodipyrimidine photo-lyase n=2 Tax=Corynebacterium pelargi TaxID=1471400 RepID=A0A410WA26_9CORY|nr:Deoxyribodipyrimidine photo-lyase [Corynebacterium pelargi]